MRRKPGQIPIGGQVVDDDERGSGDGDGRQRECGEQAPHQATHELFQHQPPPGPRNLLAKLIHDWLLVGQAFWPDRWIRRNYRSGWKA